MIVSNIFAIAALYLTYLFTTTTAKTFTTTTSVITTTTSVETTTPPPGSDPLLVDVGLNLMLLIATITTSTCFQFYPNPCTGHCFNLNGYYSLLAADPSGACSQCYCFPRSLPSMCSLPDDCKSSKQCSTRESSAPCTAYWTTQYLTNIPCPTCGCALQSIACRPPAPCYGTGSTGTFGYTFIPCQLCPGCTCYPTGTVTNGFASSTGYPPLPEPTITVHS